MPLSTGITRPHVKNALMRLKKKERNKLRERGVERGVTVEERGISIRGEELKDGDLGYDVIGFVKHISRAPSTHLILFARMKCLLEKMKDD